VAEIQRELPRGVSLVEYFSTRGYIFAAILERDSFQIQQVTEVSRIHEPLRFLRFQLEKMRCHRNSVPAREKQDLETIQFHLKELHDALIAPLREKLHGSHIIIVPHGVLHQVPFHALFDGSKYLIDSCSVSYAPSATVYALCQRNRRAPEAGVLILGLPDFRAPCIVEEVEAVHRVLPESELATGASATFELLRQRGPECRFVHIATHARFRQDNPMFSGFWLGDRFLHVHELYELHLPVELLVLSGCSTGLSMVAGGDEQMGLVRGVLCAGAQSALLTLWDVHDQTTSLFMESFYRQLIASHDRAASLQQAVWELRENQPHPYYWAPFYLVGGAC
jgi:CHAT domain-containing protein